MGLGRGGMWYCYEMHRLGSEVIHSSTPSPALPPVPKVPHSRAQGAQFSRSHSQRRSIKKDRYRKNIPRGGQHSQPRALQRVRAARQIHVFVDHDFPGRRFGDERREPPCSPLTWRSLRHEGACEQGRFLMRKRRLTGCMHACWKGRKGRWTLWSSVVCGEEA
jgi:hypothetical protein